MAAEPLVPQNYVIPNTGGITVAVNDVGTSGTQAIGADQTRNSRSPT